jgi:hypothetical protein
VRGETAAVIAEVFEKANGREEKGESRKGEKNVK